MDNHKICFISAVDNDVTYNKCLFYVNKLIIPDSYTIETIDIRDATSLTSAYNIGMSKTDAKYKVYIHQDTFILNENFIMDIIRVFKSNEKIGMLGVIGTTELPSTGVWWDGPMIGTVLDTSLGIYKQINAHSTFNTPYSIAKGIDGLIIITQYDLIWREELFDAWHFYDISQCMEFINHGYIVAVPNQESPWCFHDCGVVNTTGYDKYRRILLKEYFNVV